MSLQRQYERTKRSASSIALFFIVGAFCIGYSVSVIEPLLKNRLNLAIPPFLPQAVGLIVTFFSWNYVKETIEDAIESDVKTTTKEIKEEYEKKSPEAIKEKQELEFLAIWTDEETLNQVDFNEMSPTLREALMRDRDEFKEVVLENFRNRFTACQEILDKLGKDDNGKKILLSIVREAVDVALLKNSKDTISKEENAIYLNVYRILQAWLLCSIKFDAVMPAQSLRKIIKNSKYEIVALEYIKDKMLDDPRVAEILPNEECRKIVKFYINEFIKQVD
ncbi:hypothetical protein NDI44_20315 [Trichocoleus sp. DQ-A3]|uniref:hypothetical protein n=1 Tax=Cyanophyceae TaxID=3028117 RepID=UPI001683B771|nr:hypothetical protein [Coleofasciculus sp. FACHB-125]MBD1899787.1 hypothetical protein [Coleofasciculus sp. FACHB-125]